MRMGYACINTELAKEKIQVNRGMIRKTFLEKGIAYASELSLKNISDFSKIIDWNIRKNIRMYRMSSDMFPWMSEYDFEDLPDVETIKKILKRIGEKVKENDLRLTFHPGPYNVLATSVPNVLTNTIKDLSQHAKIMEMIGLTPTPFAKINIHVGGAYGDKATAINRFCDNFSLLPEIVQKRLTVENDDKVNMFSVKDLLEIHNRIKIPIVFDYHHHELCPGGLSEKDAMLAAYETWPESIRPIVHVSSSKKRYEDPKVSEASHADFIYKHINLYGKDVDIMIEAKAKEKALIRYVKEYKMKVK